MITPGFFSLGNFTIGAAGTVVGAPQTGLAGMLACALQGRFQWGSGGTACKLYIQTSLDQGNTWVDIACMVFGTAGLESVVNLSALTPKTTAVVATDGTLADNTVVDGILGDQIRAKVISTGTYAASTLLSVSMQAR